MIVYSLGFVNVPVAGTPIDIATVMTSMGLDPTMKCHEIAFDPKNANTNVVYVGLAKVGVAAHPQAVSSDFNKTTGVGLFAECQPPAGAAGKKDVFCIKSAHQSNTVRAADYAVDAKTNGEGFVVRITVL